MPSTERRSFDLHKSQSMQLQFREANALEYIAYYLDRIDQRLEQTGNATQSNLSAIAHIMPQILKVLAQ